MKWSSPLVELSRPAARCAASSFAAHLMLAVGTLCLTAGCSALPAMQSAPVSVAMTDGASGLDGYSDAERSRLSQLPTIPDFDLPVASAPSTNTAADAKVTEAVKPVTSPDVPTAVDPKKPAQVAATSPVAQVPADKPSVQPSDKPSELKAAQSKVAVATPVELNPAATSRAIAGAGQKGVTPPPSPSLSQLPILRIDAPKPFAWTPIGKTTGDRSFQTVTIGDEGYRSLVIGSVAGHDPLALELVEQLALRLHSRKIILGGFHSTVIRTLNPDGEALHKVLNEKGQYINHGFPKDNGVADANQPVEVTFLLGQVQSLQPQRVIHVRTIDGGEGFIAASSGCQTMAKDSAEWLGFRVIELPKKAVSGSLERYLAISGRCEMVTFAIPATTKKSELWDRYGDALQNLLMGENLAERELARKKQNQQSSANRRNSNDK